MSYLLDVTHPVHLCDMSTLSPAAAIRSAPERSFVRVSQLPGSRTAARKAASRAAETGLLLRVGAGLYYRTRETRFGLLPPRVEDVARELLGANGTGPSGHSAAHALGLTTQVPPVYHVAALRVSSDLPAGVKVSKRGNLARTDLNELEIALLEVLRSPETLVEGGWDTLSSRARELASQAAIRAEALDTVALGERNRATRDNYALLRESAFHG